MVYSIINLASAQLHSSDSIPNSQACSLRCCVAGSHSLRSWLLVSGLSTNLVYFSVDVSHTIDAYSIIGLSFLTKPLIPLRSLAITLAPSVPGRQSLSGNHTFLCSVMQGLTNGCHSTIVYFHTPKETCLHDRHGRNVPHDDRQMLIE